MTRAASKPKTHRRGKSAAKRTKQASPARVMSFRRWDAAKIDRLTADWVFSPMSANEELRQGLETIRMRARELEQNSNHARKYLAMVEANIVGRGFQLRIVGDDGSVRDAFTAWANRADVTGRLNWPDLQRLIMRTTARDGECLVRILVGGDYVDGVALQVLESDYLDTKYTETLPNGNRVIMGVEIDPNGKPVAYYLHSQHPGEYNATSGFLKRQRVSAEYLIHVARIERPGQTRAVSWMASAMGAMNMLKGYRDAELVAARISACKMGFYINPPGEDFTPDATESGTNAPLSDAAPGVFERLPTGWDFKAFDPTHPSGNYGPFVKDIQREMASGLNVAYPSFANDLEGVSFSSIRSGTIEEREQWIVLQDWGAYAALTPIISAWAKYASVAGRINSQQAEMAQTGAMWTGRRWPWVDPQSDIAAKKEEIALGLIAPSDIAAEMRGTDYASTQERIAEDNRIRNENDLQPISQSTSKAAVQDTALNGAQIASAVQIIQAAASGQIPIATVAPLLKASFPSLDDAEIASITKPLTGFEATTEPKAS